MGISDHIDSVRELHKKTVAVVLSCENMDQLSSARNYITLAKKRIEYIVNPISMVERAVKQNIYDNFEDIFRLKSRMIKKLYK